MTAARLLSLADAAEYLAVPAGTLRDWAYKRRIPFVKTGDGRSATVRFDRGDLDAWIDAHKIPARSAS